LTVMHEPFDGATAGASHAALPVFIASRHTPTPIPPQSGPSWPSLTHFPLPQSPSSQQYFAQPFDAEQP